MAINSVCVSSSRSVNFNLHHHSSLLPLCLLYSVSPVCFMGPDTSDPISSWGYDANVRVTSLRGGYHSYWRSMWELPVVVFWSSVCCVVLMTEEVACLCTVNCDL